MTSSEFLAAVRRGDVHGVYYFVGEEDYLKKRYLATARETLVPDETFAPFNILSYFGETPDVPALTEALASPPMMADGKIVSWENIVVDAKNERDREKMFTELDELAARAGEHPETLLILASSGEAFDIGSERRRTPAYKRIEKHMIPVVFDYADDRHLIPWLLRHFTDAGADATADVCRRVIERCGRSMTILSGECEKVASFVLASGRREITVRDVDEVTSPVREEEAFALTNALLASDRAAALAALADMRRRHVDPIIALSSIVRFYAELYAVSMLASDRTPPALIAKKTHLHEYKVKLYTEAARRIPPARQKKLLDVCRAMDDASKGAGSGGYLAAERFIAAYV